MPQAANQFSGIFISYRRDDSAGHAGRLFDRLSAHFGEDQIFMDIDYIKLGEDFVQVIEKAVGSCEILLAVIGRRWLSGGEDHAQRLDNPHDFVRLEIATALNRNIHVIPVLVQGAGMPSEQNLPAALSNLSRRNAHDLSDLRWHRDVDQLIRALEKILAERREARDREAQEKERQQRAAEEAERQRRKTEKSKWRAQTKLFKLATIIGVTTTMLILVLLSMYFRGITVRLLRADVTYRTARATRELSDVLADREATLSALAHAPPLRRYLSQLRANAAPPDADREAFADTRALLNDQVNSRTSDWAALMLVNTESRPIFSAESPLGSQDGATNKLGDDLPAHVTLDERVWAATEQQPLRNSMILGINGTLLRYTVPISPPTSHTAIPVGALVADLKLHQLIERIETDIARPDDTSAGRRADAAPPHFFVVLDRTGQIIYHTNHALKYQRAENALPGFTEIAHAMTAGEKGEAFFTALNGTHWLVVYQPVAGLDLSMAAAVRETTVSDGFN